MDGRGLSAGMTKKATYCIMHLTTMFTTNFYEAMHWCYDVLFFNLQASNATE